MDLDALRAFLAVVETGSFVAAAASLRWPRATLRRRVDELEAATGVPLLVRSAEGATPTEAGRALAARGKPILAEAQALVASVREVGAAPSGLVRVAIPVGLPPELLLPIFTALRAEHPKLEVALELAGDPLGALLHEVDVAFCFGEAPREGPWVTRELVRIPERVLASRAWLRTHGVPGDVDALLAQPLLVYAAPGEGEPVLRLAGGRTRRVRPVLRSADIHLLRRCAEAGLGLVHAPDAGLPHQGDPDTELVPVLEGVITGERVLRVVLPAALVDIPRIRAVLELGRTAMPSEPRAGTKRARSAR